MTRRFFYLLICSVLVFFMTLPLTSSANESIEFNEVKIEKSEEGYKLVTDISLDLPRGLENALLKGIPLYFTTQLEITRPRWYWFDEKPIESSRTIRIAYNVLTRQYNVMFTGNLQQNMNSFEDALNMVKHPPYWIFAEKDLLKEDETYFAAVRIQLDTSYLPKPFQINIINNSNWRLSSEWRRFSFKA